LSASEPFLEALQDWMEISTHRSIHAFIRHNRDSALSLSQVSTLFRLYHHGSSSVNELADHLGISMAGVSQLLDQLIEAGYLNRSEDPSDRRVKLISLTERGVTAVEASKNARHHWINELAILFTPEEKNQLLPALSLLYDRTHELMQNHNPNCKHRLRKSLRDD
jgi:DNA-binding MarR family transcriptional regulator